MSDSGAIDSILKGTPLALFIDTKAPQQRAGVLASLNIQSDTLAMLPRRDDAARSWSAAAWAQHRQGSIFITSSPRTRALQIPLMTLWLDLIILRLMSSPAPGRKTWLVLDELPTLMKLPTLPLALAEARKAQLPIVMGFQARSQMDALYGPTSEAMLSQPAAKIVLRTSEANSAEWLARTIGEIETERLRQSRNRGGHASTNYMLERQKELLLLPSEIEGLAPMRGYLKVANAVTTLHLPYVTLPPIAPAFIERTERTTSAATRPSPSSSTPAVDDVAAPAVQAHYID
jgi:type IV secretory pathway TraG/TraD family ATPase VirD4